MEQPLISIIIPAYNLEKYLAVTLDAVLAQTYKTLEIIAVDDGSKDQTKQVIQKYQTLDARVHGVFKTNGGVTSARLAGFHAANGEWIGFVDGDDYIEPDMYARLLQNAQKYDADISHCGYQMILPSGNVRMYYGTNKVLLQNHTEGLQDLLNGNFVESGLCNKLYSRRVVENFLRDTVMDTSIRINEDLLMNYYLFKGAQKSVFEDICPYHYIVRQGSAANASLNAYQLLDPLRVKELLFEETKNNAVLHRICANHLVRQLVTLSTLQSKGHEALISPIKKQSLKRLRQSLIWILRDEGCSIKSRITAVWVSIFPSSYRLVHTLYAKISGIDKIYEK